MLNSFNLSSRNTFHVGLMLIILIFIGSRTLPIILCSHTQGVELHTMADGLPKRLRGLLHLVDSPSLDINIPTTVSHSNNLINASYDNSNNITSLIHINYS